MARVHRKSYSLQELKAKAQELMNQTELDSEALFERDMRRAGAPVWEWREGLDRVDLRERGGMLAERLPPEARKVSFSELALALAADERGYALLTGVERGSAGLDEFRLLRWQSGDSYEVCGSFSFCVNDVTYTAFEDSDDCYRSSLSYLVARDGNWCETWFEPCALLPEFLVSRSWEEPAGGVGADHPDAGMADVLSLLNPSTLLPAVSVGTNRGDEWYPSFVGSHDPIQLELARELGIGLAYELDCGEDGLALGAPSRAPSRRRL